MTRTSVSKLRAKLGQYMRAVRQGREVIITDRDDPVARLVPYETPEAPHELAFSRAADPTAPSPGRVTVRAVRYHGPSTMALLRGDRDRR